MTVATALAMFLEAVGQGPWTVERTWDICRQEEPCEHWAEATMPDLRAKCVQVQGYTAACWTWGPADTGWRVFFD